MIYIYTKIVVSLDILGLAGMKEAHVFPLKVADKLHHKERQLAIQILLLKA